MVINDRHRFVFVHIPKTAGTSMMAALGALPGTNRRWMAPDTKHETLSTFQARWRGRRSFWDKVCWRNPTRFRSFAFVRNPWDRMSSYYRYLKEQRPTERADSVHSFADFLEQAADGVAWIRERHAMRPQTDFFTFGDEPGHRRRKLDFLGHFEHLSDDVHEIALRLGIAIDLGHENRSANARCDFRREYTQRMLDIVGQLYGDEAALSGYSPEERLPAKRCSGPLEMRC